MPRHARPTGPLSSILSDECVWHMLALRVLALGRHASLDDASLSISLVSAASSWKALLRSAELAAVFAGHNMLGERLSGSAPPVVDLHVGSAAPGSTSYWGLYFNSRFPPERPAIVTPQGVVLVPTWPGRAGVCMRDAASLGPTLWEYTPEADEDHGTGEGTPLAPKIFLGGAAQGPWLAVIWRQTFTGLRTIRYSMTLFHKLEKTAHTALFDVELGKEPESLPHRWISICMPYIYIVSISEPDYIGVYSLSTGQQEQRIEWKDPLRPRPSLDWYPICELRTDGEYLFLNMGPPKGLAALHRTTKRLTWCWRRMFIHSQPKRLPRLEMHLFDLKLSPGSAEARLERIRGRRTPNQQPMPQLWAIFPETETLWASMGSGGDGGPSFVNIWLLVNYKQAFSGVVHRGASFLAEIRISSGILLPFEPIPSVYGMALLPLMTDSGKMPLVPHVLDWHHGIAHMKLIPLRHEAIGERSTHKTVLGILSRNIRPRWVGTVMTLASGPKGQGTVLCTSTTLGKMESGRLTRHHHIHRKARYRL